MWILLAKLLTLVLSAPNRILLVDSFLSYSSFSCLEYPGFYDLASNLGLVLINKWKMERYMILETIFKRELNPFAIESGNIDCTIICDFYFLRVVYYSESTESFAIEESKIGFTILNWIRKGEKSNVIAVCVGITKKTLKLWMRWI